MQYDVNARGDFFPKIPSVSLARYYTFCTSVCQLSTRVQFHATYHLIRYLEKHVLCLNPSLPYSKCTCLLSLYILRSPRRGGRPYTRSGEPIHDNYSLFKAHHHKRTIQIWQISYLQLAATSDRIFP